MASILQQPAVRTTARQKPARRSSALRASRGKHRVLLLVHAHLVPPAKADAPEDTHAYQAELDVLEALKAMGHEVEVLGLADDLAPIGIAVANYKPDVVFNLIESFNNYRHFDQHVVSYLECLGVRYTGCNPRGLTLARDKSLAKKILSYHGIRLPEFQSFGVGRAISPSATLPLPAVVKSASDDGSIGIAKASVVNTLDELKERVRFIHDTLKTDAIAEQYIEGRELYVGVWGNRRPVVLPVWELDLSSLPAGTPRIVTNRVKMDVDYQKKYAITSGKAKLTPSQERAIHHLAVVAYRELSLSGYARLDLRMTASGDVYFIEANPNPQISKTEDFSQSADELAGGYQGVIGQLLHLAFSYSPVGMA
jgi:D-alanine-D-alanine ligase